ncbi:cytochrome c3 family protein [Ferribacterium limneticum]|uniref:cytochrome c3 family protein n=1 Tax=Ferribacterium limneticum TaxID=76259 RepID=UPI001CF810FC|nr:cytochrome c3 family protein [Ferribacterium limneticum]UCV21462.1 hypothetical protein KI613_13005 [Ferribacterium limneticum]
MKYLARLLLVVLAATALLFGQWGSAFAQTQEGGAQNLSFDHNTTGYILDNTHKQVNCETCHTSGVFRGTPRTCATCHAGAGARAPGKPATHIPATAACDACHRAGASSWSEKPTGFIQGASGHAINPLLGVTATNCQTCHNGAFIGANALTKPATHMQTSAACSTCHTTTSWMPATNPHAGVQPGTCATCHNGVNAPGKLVDHIPTSAACDTCHQNFTNFVPARMDHTGQNGQCSTCHSGRFSSQSAQSKPATHLATAQQCDTCHLSTTSWAVATFDHANRPSGSVCTDCHTPGGSGLSKPNNHVPTTAACDTCHTNFVSFSPAQMNHSATAGNCSSCHNGAFVSVNALSKSGRHIPTVVQCDSCHTSGFVSWSPVRMNHTGLDGQCSSCHSGGYLPQNAQAKTATHISTTAQCDSCHASTSTWATGVFNHANASPAAAGRCSTCHNGSNALGKSINHIPTAGQCDSCHNTFTSFSSVAMSHAGTAGACSSCHNGSFVFANALAKTGVHVPTGAQCDTCHTGGFNAWSPAVMNHSGLNGQCSTCHGGGYVSQNALEKPLSHVTTTAQCDTCHGSTTSWATATYSHDASAIGRCDTCHGVTALGKSARHIPTVTTAANCGSCHNNYASFKPAAMDHAATGGAACSTCHGGTYVSQNALTKPATHIQTSATCDSCHGNGNGFTSWASGSFNHAAASPSVLGRCTDCHNGVNAQSKSAVHVPTSSSCENCHGTSYSAFKPGRMNHAVTSEACATCHGGAYTGQGALAKPTNHIPATGACDTCHGTGNNFTSWAPSAMDHTGQTQCSTCHGGAYVAQNAQAKPTTHQPTSAQCSDCHTSTTSWRVGAVQNHALLTPPVAIGDHSCNGCHNGTAGKGLSKPSTHIPTTGFCDTCHTNFNTFAPASMSHAGITSGCTSCHGGAHVSLNALAKQTSHIPTSASCESCHGATSFTAFKPASMNHTGTGGLCSTCHAGGFVALNALPKPTKHVSTSAQCDSCHSSTTVWSGARYPHTGATGTCSNCHGHSGTVTVLGALAKPQTGHVATTAQCDTCHRSTTAWTGATYAHAASAVGTCSNCHNGTTAPGKPLGTAHIPTTAQCDTCHKNYTAFRPASMSHAGTAGACISCHGGGYVSFNAQAKHGTHISTSQSCDTCHGTTAWKPAVNFHAGVVAGTCVTCHNGTNATGKNLTHIPTTLACDTCHRTSDAHFAPAHMTHTATMTSQCSSCHGGNYVGVNALAKPLTHVSTTAQCDTCHKTTTTWTGAVYTHPATATGTCSNCHNGSVLGAQGKNVGHIATTAQCDSCHKSMTVWTGASYTHAASAVGTCSNCHNGSAAPGKTTGHIPTSSQCDNCHKNYTTFRPASMSHTGTTGLCLTCHNGGYTAVNAQAKNTGHLVTNDSCDSCHRTTAWLPASFAHTPAQLAGKTCVSCHNGTTATGKPALHIPTSEACSVCHRTGGTWMPLITPYAHTVVVAGSCANCHTTSYPGMSYKPLANHVPTTASCDACHTRTSWTTLAAFNHVGATTCQTCHSGMYVGVKGKHTTHIPTTLAGLPGNECSLCHVGTTSFTTVSRMNHGSIQTNCKTCHSSTTAYDVGGAEKIRLGGHEGSKATDDCSQSSCHKPLGRKGTPYTKWD